MKRLLLILFGTLFVFGLFGCGSDGSASSGIDSGAAPANQAPVEQPDPKGSGNTTQGATQTDM